MNNKKVLLPERKRHTARRIAIASPCYSGGEVPRQKFFFRSEHVSSQIWCQNFFPLLGGGPLTKFFFASLNMYQTKSGVKNFSLYWGGGGGVPQQNFFFWSEHVSSQIWCQKCFPLLRLGTPPQTWTWAPPGPETGYPPRPGPWTPLELDLGPPYLDLDLGPPYLDLGPPGPGPGTPPDLDLGPPTWTWTWEPPYLDLDLGPPPDLDLGPPHTWTWDPPKSEQTDISKCKYYLPSYCVRGR